MKKWFIMMMALFVVATLQPTLSYTQEPSPADIEEIDDFEFDEELDITEEDAPPPPNQPGVEVNETDPVKPKPLGNNRSRFRRNQRPQFNQPEPEVIAPPVNTGPTTPVGDIKKTGKKKNRKKKKIKFAEAQPEDITNENFPEIIESFDYPNADINDVAKAIAKLTGKNFIFEPGVRGKITIVAPSQITVAEAWEAFLSALAMNNFTIVPAGKFLKIRKISNAKNDSIETFTGDYYPTSDQLITRVIKLKFISAEDVKKSLGNFISKKAGDIVAYEKTNSIIVSGYGSTIERISRIIEQLDKPGFEERLEVIPIRNAKAKDLADLIDKIINKDKDKKGSRFRSSRFSRNKQEKTEALSLVAPDERTNSLIVVGNGDGVKRIKRLVAKLDYPLDPADAGGVYVYYVKHGEAKKISETLSGIAQETAKSAQTANKSKSKDADFEPPKKIKPLFGGNVTIKADENTNSLIIMANKQDYKIVKNLLAKIDIQKDQVFVEAVIMEMEASDKNLWNMNYMKFFPSGDGAVGAANADGIARAGFTKGGQTLGDLLSPIGGSGAILTLGEGENVTIDIGGRTVTIPSLLALINFLKEKTNANILSTPHILAMDNEESEIEVGERVPVAANTNAVAATGITTQSADFKDATIYLKIKPFISKDSDSIRLEVEQRISKVSTKPIRAAALAASTQSLNKKEVKTNIVLDDGQTAVLGGLMEDQDEITETKVPLLGDIPILGWLFKNRTVESRKTNLVVFLTPNIVRTSSDQRKILREKLNDRIDWIKKYQGGRDPYGETFNKRIQMKADSGVMSSPDTNEMELDVEEATPLEDNSDEGDQSDFDSEDV